MLRIRRKAYKHVLHIHEKQLYSVVNFKLSIKFLKTKSKTILFIHQRPVFYIPHDRPSVAISVCPLKYELNKSKRRFFFIFLNNTFPKLTRSQNSLLEEDEKEKGPELFR